MRKRNVAILFRLNKKEAEVLDKKVKKSGLNREAYLRQLISGVVPRDAPPPDYYSMMRELHKIGNNLNQIAQKAHVLNVIDVQRYDQEVWKFNEAVRHTNDHINKNGTKNKHADIKVQRFSVFFYFILSFCHQETSFTLEKPRLASEASHT